MKDEYKCLEQLNGSFELTLALSTVSSLIIYNEEPLIFFIIVFLILCQSAFTLVVHFTFRGPWPCQKSPFIT